MTIFETLLEDFKRANKTARTKLAVKFGFPSAEAYMAHLQELIGIAGPQAALTDMVIAFDTTGSMSSYIAAVRKHVQETVKNLFDNTPNLNLKIVAFGDYCDMPSPTVFGKAYQETILTDDRQYLIEFVKKAQNTGGGDSDEFYELVLQKILDETPWREGSNRTILLIADCAPHYVGYTLLPWVRNAQIDWRQEANKAARMHVRIDTLRIHPHELWYAELSMMTEGTCMNFSTAGKTQHIVEASTYFASGSTQSLNAVKRKYRKAVEDGDSELVGAYKGMAATRSINLDE